MTISGGEQARLDGLLQAIIAEPEADDLRLIFADAAEEDGQPHVAARIRWGIDFPGVCLSCKGNRWWIREQGFPGPTPLAWQGLNAILCEALPCRHGQPGLSFTVTRGFISRVRLPCAAWLEHGPVLVTQHPLERVEISDVVVEHVEREPGFPCWHIALPLIGSVGFCRLPWWDIGWHNTSDDALAALSRGCLAWARSREIRGQREPSPVQRVPRTDL